MNVLSTTMMMDEGKQRAVLAVRLDAVAGLPRQARGSQLMTSYNISVGR